jgi:hypothetical protein
LDTITDESSEANIADIFVRPGPSSKEHIILAKFSKEHAIAVLLDEDGVGYDWFGCHFIHIRIIP